MRCDDYRITNAIFVVFIVICAGLVAFCGFAAVDMFQFMLNVHEVPLSPNQSDTGCMYGDAWIPYTSEEGTCPASACVLGNSTAIKSNPPTCGLTIQIFLIILVIVVGVASIGLIIAIISSMIVDARRRANE